MEITQDLIKTYQEKWGQGIVAIGKAFTDKGDFEGAAAQHVDTLYAYGLTEIHFKPTKAKDIQFRKTRDEALSYFVAKNGACPEDKGFALQPWSKVQFENSTVSIHGNTAVAMGNYYFTDLDGGVAKVEYTFGYILDDSGELRIHLHHSSLPFAG